MIAQCKAERLFCQFLDSQPPFDGLLVALSGGADSVTLLHLAHRYRERYGYRLEALHVHHGIRGDEADRDREFCQHLCAEWKIPFKVVKLDIPALAATERSGIEETARRYRYAMLEDYASKRGLDRIATAHTATDNLETVLLQLTRGCASIIGIPPVRGHYLRPLLDATREDILHYLKQWQLPHVEDSSNASDAYSRNLIRHRVLPALRELNPRAEEAFTRAATLSRRDTAYLDALAANAAQSGRVDEIASLPPPLRNRALAARCKELGIGEIGYVHLDALAALIESPRPHASLSLPGGAVTIEDGVLVRRVPLPADAPWETELVMGENPLPDGSILCLSTENREEIEKYISSQQNIYKLLIKVTMNFATIKGTMYARSRRPGDRIFSGGMHRSVKKLYCDAHVPPADRITFPIVCDGDGILWLPAIGKIRDQMLAPHHPALHLILFRKGTENETV